MANGKQKRPRKKKPVSGRRKFSSPEQTRAQLEGITAAQQRYRRAKRRNASQTEAAEVSDPHGEAIIIESREKSEQALKNTLRAVHRPEDLDDFD